MIINWAIEVKLRRNVVQDLIGKTLGNYYLSRILGEGSFAVVYLGQHIQLEGRRVAIKVLKNQMISDKEKNSFHGEARTLAHLEHPNIMPVLDFGTEPISYLIMKYAPVSLLQQHPRRTLVPLNIVIAYVKQIAFALQYAHAKKIIHRDIKPANLLLGEQNEILVSDFGIATIAHNTISLVKQTCAGTPPYMAPEQFNGHPECASDQYALGIMVYEWLAGQRPFHGTPYELMNQHVRNPPPSLIEQVPGLSPEVEKVIFKALTKDHKQRYKSILAFANALEEAAGKDIAPPSSARTDIAEESTIIMGVSNLSVTEVQEQSYTRGRTQLTYRYHDNSVAAVAWSPDDKHIALGSGKRVHVLNADMGDEVFTYEGHRDRVSSVAWSPDGECIASASRDGSLQMWEAVDGNRRGVYKQYPVTVSSVAYSPDGRCLAVGCGDNTVRVLRVSNGKSKYIYKGHNCPVSAVAWFGSERGLIASSSEDGSVQIWSWDDVTKRWIDFDFFTEVKALAPSPYERRFACVLDRQKVVLVRRVKNNDDDDDTVYQKNHEGIVYSVAWSPDGKRIASACNDNTVQVWEAEYGKHIYTYTKHSGGVRAIAWSPDGKRIASASDDNTVQVWWVA
jgi:serine/threonine protein kinase